MWSLTVYLAKVSAGMYLAPEIRCKQLCQERGLESNINVLFRHTLAPHEQSKG